MHMHSQTVQNILSFLLLAPGGQERGNGSHISTSTIGGRKDQAMGPRVFLLSTGRDLDVMVVCHSQVDWGLADLNDFYKWNSNSILTN